MLCRVADSLFWMARYIERAENTVRLVDVTLQTLLESEHSPDEDQYKNWSPILASLGDQALFESLYEDKSSSNITDFLIFSRENPSSVLQCISAARENARMIRDQISSEMWEVINRTYLWLKKQDPQKVCVEADYEFFQHIKEFSQLFQGLVDTTFPHQIGFEFVKIGANLERADKTCRILDAKRYMLQDSPAKDDALDNAQWAAILRGCSAHEAYRRVYVADIEGDTVRDFLLRSRDFPRSVLYCLTRTQLALHAISKCPTTHFSNEAERRLGQLIAKLNYANPNDLNGKEAHKLIESIENDLGEIAVQINERYMFSEIVDPAEDLEQAQA
ncbi:alpha-E domain-containing protein [Pelagicoccus sp. SDUM812002]|uniref:alpha-E domain-containing protein n=1 Tax=Pelagicoccus sp. SDUM812002 TaxID=3041266 RepID=UPI00280E3526|nr:alpha-E domain-containing protein [Pelagicoccus sp. SDUM812002]MDQ8187233.1 alpha-E domain-containing protein [Pelagicoccus sp. SDUM812002]